jgi:hypothetical protein
MAPMFRRIIGQAGIIPKSRFDCRISHARHDGMRKKFVRSSFGFPLLSLRGGGFNNGLGLKLTINLDLDALKRSQNGRFARGNR